MVYLTGDTHGQFKNFENIRKFCKEHNTTIEDVLIILGDAGINFEDSFLDPQKKKFLSKIPVTFLCIHGNHECRPEHILTYNLEEWDDGLVYKEEDYPNILFAKDGEIYNIEGLKYIAIGGAYSVDKEYRLLMGWSWWKDEQPSEETKKYTQNQLEKNNWNIDVVLSHTVPLKYEPVEMFLPGINQSKVDKSTEEWLDKIESRLSYKKWYAGHYHCEKSIDRLQIMFNNIEELRIIEKL